MREGPGTCSDDLAYISAHVVRAAAPAPGPAQRPAARGRVLLEAGTSGSESEGESGRSPTLSDRVRGILAQETESEGEREGGPEEGERPTEEDRDCPASVPAHHRLEFIGPLQCTVGGRQAVVQSSTVHSPLDRGTVLCASDRSTIGRVVDTFGPVASPLYLVALGRAAAEETLVPGLRVFFSPELATLASVQQTSGSSGPDSEDECERECERGPAGGGPLVY